MKKVKRGEIYTINLIDKDTTGVEIGKVRPGLVVQANAWNSVLPSTIILPLSSSIPLYASAGTVVLSEEAGLFKNSNVMFSQIRSIDSRRLVKKVGEVNKEKMKEVERALSLTLGLEPLE